MKVGGVLPNDAQVSLKKLQFQTEQFSVEDSRTPNQLATPPPPHHQTVREHQWRSKVLVGIKLINLSVRVCVSNSQNTYSVFLQISNEVYAELSRGIPTKTHLIFKKIVLLILSPLSRDRLFHRTTQATLLGPVSRFVFHPSSLSEHSGKTDLQRGSVPFSVSRLISSVVPSSPFLSFLSPLPVYPKASHCSTSPHSLSAHADSLLARSVGVSHSHSPIHPLLTDL